MPTGKLLPFFISIFLMILEPFKIFINYMWYNINNFANKSMNFL